MARKHDKFSYSYGWRTAPEQWKFYWNDKLIHLDRETRSSVSNLMLQGKETEAEAILKRELRKQEKEEAYICIGFFGKNSKQLYLTQDLRCTRNDLQGKLHAYKEWRHYIEMRDCDLALNTVTSGYLQADGKMSEGKTEESKDIVDLKRPCIIRLIKPMEKTVFQF